jgi:hypothetical protein
VVEALADNADGRFSLGQYVTLDFLTQQRRNVMVVPAESIVQVQEGTGSPRSAVWTVVKDGQETKAHRNFVLLGVSDGRRQEVRSGLKEGDVVITKGQGLLTEGSPVLLPGEAPPVTATASSSSASGGMTQKAGSFTVALSTDPSPPKAGDVTLRLKIADSAGTAVSGAKVHLDTSMYTMGMGGPSAEAKDEGGGNYSALISMGMGGPWRVEAKIRMPGQMPATARFDFPVK